MAEIESQEEQQPLVSAIPVRNLWILMLYASSLYREQASTFVNVEKNPEDIVDLVARILCKRVEERLLRNFSQDYEIRSGILGSVRGRIDFLRTDRHLLLELGKVACRYEELGINTARNCFVRAAIEEAVSLVQCEELRKKCKILAGRLHNLGIVGPKPSSRVAVNVFGSLDRQDRPMVEAARLIFEMAIPSEEKGSRLLSSPEDKITWLRKLYEKAIGGFYDVNLPHSEWHVDQGMSLQWCIEEKTSGIDAILPGMKTDIVLENRNAGRRIIIDTKFNRLLVSGWYRDNTIRNGYLYQIYTYLRSQEGRNDDLLSESAAGVLLHPSVGKKYDETVRIQKHAIRFKTVNLAGSVEDMKNDLLEVCRRPEYV